MSANSRDMADKSTTRFSCNTLQSHNRFNYCRCCRHRVRDRFPVTTLLLLLPLLLNVLLRAEHLEAFLYESFGGLELFVVLDLVELTTNQQKY